MTNNEIVRDWASAKHPARQIEILAHLNSLSVPKIREILRENGAHVVANAYSEGATLAQLYTHYGLDKQTIRDMIVSAGVEIRSKGCVVTPAEAPAEPVEPAADTAEAPPAAKPAKRAKQLNPYELARRFERLAVAGGLRLRAALNMTLRCCARTISSRRAFRLSALRTRLRSTRKRCGGSGDL